MTTPERKSEPARHLDAALVPLKNALQHRANELGSSQEMQMVLRQAGLAPHNASTVGRALAGFIAAEFRKLADELHHW